MARLKTLPNLQIIRGFKGTIDFAVWKGLPYARAWPRFRRAKLTAASLAAATLFGQIISSYSLLAGQARIFFIEDAKDQPRTPRDIFVSAVYGRLHEASMSDFLDLLTECRDFLSDLTDLLHALDSVGTDELDVNVEDSVLPDGAATAAHQVTQSASLAAIETLADALESVDTDALQIRGRDQVFSYKAELHKQQRDFNASAGLNVFTIGPVPADEVWLVTGISAADHDNVITAIQINKRFNDERGRVKCLLAPPIDTGIEWTGLLPVSPTMSIYIRFLNVILNDFLHAAVVGYIMTKET